MGLVDSPMWCFFDDPLIFFPTSVNLVAMPLVDIFTLVVYFIFSVDRRFASFKLSIHGAYLNL